MTVADVLTDDGRGAALEQIEAATAGLLRTIGSLSDQDVRESSLLPGWTRAHVLTHVARNAEAIANLFRRARTGQPGVAYASQEARDAGIEEGSRRSAAELLADLTDTADLFRTEAVAVPATAWDLPARMVTPPDFPLAEALVRRLVEVELHHVDLGVGYTWRDWPETFVQLPLSDPQRTWRADRMR